MADKYNEIMEHIRLTEEAKEHILSNVSKIRVSEDVKDTKIICLRKWKRWGALAACLAVVLIGIFSLRHDVPLPGNDDPQVMLPGGVEEYKSASALSEAIGFPVEDIAILSADGDEICYENLFDEIAQVTVNSDNQQITFRKAIGEKDISSDYDDYSATAEITISGISIILKGCENQYTLAGWQNDGYTYSLRIEPSVPEKVWKTMVESVIKQ